MDILMLGHSGAGKTTFMAGLYAVMKTGKVGYNIDCNFAEYYRYNYKTNSDFGLLCKSFDTQEKDLEKIAHDISAGKYPPATMVKQEYFFNLIREDNKIPFNWFDYRGGALMESSVTSEDARLLKDKIANSDALVVFLDSEVLVQDAGKNMMHYKRLISLIRRVMCEVRMEEDEYFPISFVMTKGDMFPNVDLLDTPGLNYINDTLFNDIRESKNLVGMLTIVEINKEHIFNVHFPLLFSVLHGLLPYSRKLIEDYKQNAKNRSLWGDIKEFFTESEKESLVSQLNVLQENLENLNKFMNENNGKSIYIF